LSDCGVAAHRRCFGMDSSLSPGNHLKIASSHGRDIWATRRKQMNMEKQMTGKQRMLNAYRGIFNDRVAIAPEFWYYYPSKVLGGKVTMNGNIHTVETLIRGNTADVRREVREVREAFAGNPRVILGTGDQVGRETPEENLYAMIDEAKKWRE